MIEDSDRFKLRFELANKNFQSVGRAQGLYVTALLVFMSLVWIMFFSPTPAPSSFHFSWLELKTEDVWRITPVITLVLTLAIVGTLNAAMTAFKEVQAAGSDVFGEVFVSMFQVDNHKNLMDYLALLQVLPHSRTRKPSDVKGGSILRRLPHLLFPSLFLLSLVTSYWAIHEMYLNAARHGFVVCGWACFGLQVLFSLRPFYRWLGRFSGAGLDSNVYN